MQAASDIERREMPYFINCDEGWVNLDHVVKIEYQRCRNPGVLFYGADGTSIGIKTDCAAEFNLEEAIAPVVAAAAGATAVVMSATCGESPNGRPTETYAESVPIAAWRLVYNVAMPIFVEAPMPGDSVFVVLPDGRVMEPGGGVFDTTADAKEGVLRRAQVRWDREYAARKVLAT
jgi:hypothetical protein